MRIKTPKLSAPFVAALVIGALLVEIASNLPPEARLASIWMAFVGACVLAYVLTRYLADRGRAKSRRLRLGVLWGLCSLACAAALLYAVREHRRVRNPDKWLELRAELQDIPFEVPPGEVDYAIEMTPTFEGEVQKVENRNSETFSWPLEQRNDPVEENVSSNFMTMGYLCLLTNKGTKPLSGIELYFPVHYTHVRDSDSRSLPPDKKVRVTIEKLSPGEVFALVVYSKESDLYSEVDLPETAKVRLPNEQLPRVLHVTFMQKNRYPSSQLLTGGTDLLRQGRH